MDQPKACQRCVNFIEEQEGFRSCDYDYFVDVKYEQAIFFVPEFFNCFEYEKMEE